MRRYFLLLGPLAGILFFATVYVLAAMLPDYSHVAETVSEIGETGSPAALPFQMGMLAVNLCVILFGIGLLRFAGQQGFSRASAFFVIYFGVMDIGTNLFPSPHPLHNVFGLSLTIGYLAPLVMALTWRRVEVVRRIAKVSLIVALLIFVSIFLNISPAFHRDLYPFEYYGVVQRSLFVLFYGWCAYVGLKAWPMAGQGDRLAA